MRALLETMARLGITVRSSAISIPPCSGEVVYIRFDELVEQRDCNVTDMGNMLQRVVYSLFQTNEDLNGELTLDDLSHQYVIRLLSDGHVEDLNHPLVYVPQKRFSICLPEEHNLYCAEVEIDLNLIIAKLENLMNVMIK